MYYNTKDKKWFQNRKQAKDYYGVSYFRKLLHNKEIIYTDSNNIANDELHSNTKIDSDVPQWTH